MKTMFLFVALCLGAAAGPAAVRECYSRFIAVNARGERFDQISQCPSCGWPAVKGVPRIAELKCCGRCSHSWRLGGTILFSVFEPERKPPVR
jgi:hypothetical protein